MDTQESGDHGFGVCPECGRTDGYLNVGAQHWFVCHAHKTRWCAGENLLSSWQHQDAEEWERNRQKLKSYRDVEPRPSSRRAECMICQALATHHCAIGHVAVGCACDRCAARLANDEFPAKFLFVARAWGKTLPQDSHAYLQTPDDIDLDKERAVQWAQNVSYECPIPIPADAQELDEFSAWVKGKFTVTEK